MEIDKKKIISKLRGTFGEKQDEVKNVRLWASSDAFNMDEILNYLGEKIIDSNYTEEIGLNFREILLYIVTNKFTIESSDTLLHQKKCVALSKLLRFSPDIQRFCLTFFSKMPAPFDSTNAAPKKKLAKVSVADTTSKFEIVECCFKFLKSNVNYYKSAWNWSQFIDKYCTNVNEAENNHLYKLISNHILALLINMTAAQLKHLNKDIPIDVIISFESTLTIESGICTDIAITQTETANDTIHWEFADDSLTNVEGVVLPIFDARNYSFFKNSNADGRHDDRIVMVESARLNLRSISLGVAAGKAVCLAGPVGSGKTTLVEYLAYRTGRIPPKFADIERTTRLSKKETKENSSGNVNDVSAKVNATKKNKRKAEIPTENGNEGDVDAQLDMFYDKKSPPNGFLRIQLGDQTDSKMLLGQYRCTDVPGEFVWQPGVLTQAVMNGYWLLLEDLDSCTQDVCTVLTNLLENNHLSVPGFRDCLQISSGFQLFITLRTNKGAQSQNSYFQLLDKYLYTIHILPLSRNELCEIVCEKYPKLATISDRIVDVFITFSSGCHFVDVEPEENNQMDVTAITEVENNPKAARNSGRLVSTRDLLKLCSRSSPTFSITSHECAYFVFQNAVDLFCSHLVQGDAKNNLIASIGAKLGIIPSRCEYLSNEHKPNVLVDGIRSIKIGRVELTRRSNDPTEGDQMLKRHSNDDFDLTGVQKRLKLDSSSHLNIYQQMKRKVPNFSFTRLASCILERISVAVEENEPVLLVGETGVGKTSSVQYLSYQTNHKLVVINMNNQSDVSDLIGGFKPVDLSFVMAPLRSEFEYLFKQTFNAGKNEKFLNNISICYNQADFSVLIRLMLKIVDTVFYRKDTVNADTQKIERVLDRWSGLKIKLLKLNSQLKNSINISFAFITGSLVNCIKNGDWVLLDEINLASTETLECLSTILEPNGSIVLLERGDFMPVKRHPDFRIFACMNPSTDIGKKDLAVGIRNRFTEFFVDELTSESDLIILVGDYLNNTGIQKTKVLAIVKLYRKLRAMAQLDLNDGLGNRPVYSLRTLCRALSICAKNLCGSVERNLYESFCLSFLTQLDPASHLLVLDLVQKSLLSNKKAVLSQKIPAPDGEPIDFEGYWIQKGPREIQACENYILTESVQENLKDLARVISIGKLPVLLQGPTSAGKTSLIDYVAKRSGNYCLRINNHEHTDLQEYIGTYTADVSGKLSFKQGVLVQAMKNGYWIILDELNLAPSDILEALNRVLDDNRELFIPETQELIKAHPNFMLFATQNPPGLYGGRKTLSRAFKNRFIELHFSEIPKQELEIILEKRCLIPKSYAQKMVKTMSELQANRKSTAKGSFTLRDLFRWGNRYTYANSELMKNNLYDWNQHLVDEGYLVLSSKIRNKYEVDIIESELFNNFRKKINVKNLFSLHENTSMVTKTLLQSIADHPNYNNIVWTMNMRRMAILTGKALQFNEPVLLVGQTGCGKTTICQILADIASKNLRILNCHMHTEGADFLGGLRPYRGEQNTEDGGNRQLFEWANGPLITSMVEGTFFLADEISLAEDSVLERLNCVLEPERTILLAEKGGCNENFINDADHNESGEFVIKATNGFQFLATMNPGGDFGKKELSPALRNRFTEVWCRSIDGKDDLIRIAEHSLKTQYGTINQHNTDVLISDIANIMVKTVFFIKQNIEKFNYSIRDILAWVQFVTTNSDIKGNATSRLSVHETIMLGLETMFLDSLEMLPHESYAEIESQRSDIIKYAINQIRERLQMKLQIQDLLAKKGTEIEDRPDSFGIYPFYTTANPNRSAKNGDFKFTAPTTQKNLFRLLSALSLHKAILLEGPPGVGKTSLIENLASAIGYEIVRINLCEHTDLADLFGTDQPSDDNSFELGSATKDVETPTLGSFVWRDGPLLAALKAPNTWILLDELNLAPQSVLEGLNAILDHRGEVYIPELNKTFKLGKQTRIFASQNPLRQGGGRKGLPQSFLNRFTKVYLCKLNSIDLCHVINAKYAAYFHQLEDHLFPENARKDNSSAVSYFDLAKNEFKSLENVSKFDCCDRMVAFSEKLDNGINSLEFGYKGGPYEVNLRDILRWCDLLSNSKTGLLAKPTEKTTIERYNEFILILYEKMKLVYCQRMRTDIDKAYIRNVFSEVFCCDANSLEIRASDISLYWNDQCIYLNDIQIDITCGNNVGKADEVSLQHLVARTKQTVPLVLSTQRESLKSLVECVIMETPVILCGPTDSGKTKLVDVLCTLSNRYCNVDTIDDSVTGSFQQIDLNRHLEEISQSVEVILIQYLQNCILDQHMGSDVVNLLSAWELFVALNSNNKGLAAQSAMSEELIIFKKRLQSLGNVLQLLTNVVHEAQTEQLKAKIKALVFIVRNTETLNTGGHFEWVDSKIVRALKIGQYISLEHVNLCSSAILDRLNSVFEPNGKLLLSEKGVSTATNNQSESVSKHAEFRAFLTLDPRNGEISRAMRNRCIELNLNKDSYSHDDLKELIYENGICEMHRIEWILRVHSRLQQLTEFHSFNVSHLSKFAFLVSENVRLGSDERTSLYESALEVYVRSAHIDLLGFGLKYYRNKLREEITDELNTVPDTCVNLIPYENVIIRANNLNSLALIRLQCAPLFTAIKCLVADLDEDKIKTVFAALREQFGVRNLSPNWQSVKYMLYILYELSSSSDLKLREKYVEKFLNVVLSNAFKPKKCVNDIKINENTEEDRTLFEALPHKLLLDLISFNKNYSLEIHTATQSGCHALPWNHHMFPRIRDYSSQPMLPTSDQLKLSAILLVQLSFNEIEVDNKVKRSDINAIAYSKAVTAKTIPNGLDKDLITYLYPFLENLKSVVIYIVQQSVTFGYEQYRELICAYLWSNRLYEVSKTKLFAEKSFKQVLIDKLTLHFNWLAKHLLSKLQKLNIDSVNEPKTLMQFRKCHAKLVKYIADNHHPLSEVRKRFVKTLTNFTPFYEEKQILFDAQVQDYAKQTHLVTSDWENAKSVDGKGSALKRLRIIISAECDAYKQFLLDQTDADDLKWLYELRTEVLANISDKEILAAFEKLQKTSDNPLEHISTKDLVEQKEKFAMLCKSIEDIAPTSNLKSFKLIVSILPILEYFALRALNPIHCNKSRNYSLNMEYFKSIKSMGINELNLIRSVSCETFKLCEAIWTSVQQPNDMSNSIDCKSIMAALPTGFYKNFSTFMRTLGTRMRQFSLNSIASNQQICCDFDKEQPPKFDALPANGAILTTTVLLSLFEENGCLRASGLGDLDVWRTTLTSLSQIVWNNIEMIQNNFNFERANVEQSVVYGQKLLSEVRLIQSRVTETNESKQFLEEFHQLIGHLDSEVQNLSTNEMSDTSPQARLKSFYHSALINSILGTVELHLLTFMPLVDPVEKNRLKKLYIEEDQLHLAGIVSAYDFMKVIMSYDGLGEEIVQQLQSKQGNLKTLLEKYSKKCAMRPEICGYAELVDQTNFFLENGCRPKTQLGLITDIDCAFKRFNGDTKLTRDDLQNVNEIIKRIDWCLNIAESFEQSTISRFSTYYRDFTAPLQSSVSMLKYGFTGLKQCLIKSRDSIILKSGGAILHRMNEKEAISEVLVNLIEYPSVRGLRILPDEHGLMQKVSVMDVMEKLDNKDLAYFLLMKSKLQEIDCSLIVSQSMNSNVFKQFETMLSIFNDIWKQQEEIKRARAIEEESLYVNKTRCATEDEEEINNEEIETIFPNYAEADFGEFIQNATLEQIQKREPSKSKTHNDILNENDLKFIGDTFIDIMFKYSRLKYYKPTKAADGSLKHKLNIISAYKTKLNVFYQLVQKYKTSLSSSVDDAFYNGIGLLIGIVQDTYELLELKETSTTSAAYNFYKDSNIPEIHRTSALLNKLETRVLSELQLWPDHAVLNDIILIIARIRSLPSTSPVARFSTGFQILRQKVDEWNSVAHKLNHLRDLEIEIAEYIQRWTKLELQCWRECLTTTFEKIKSKAYRYWFFIYNLLHEYLQCSKSTVKCDLTDFKSVEKCFGNSEIDVDASDNNDQAKPKLSSFEVISVLKQFIESSNYGEFNLRMLTLKSFEFYLHYMTVGSAKRRDSMISIIHNLHSYYSQFAVEIEETIKSMRTPIEKKLKEFVKIESYNKDLSYYSMKNNVARVHRHLHKFLREFETALMGKIASVFVWRANQTVSLASEPNDKGTNLRYQPKITYYMIDIKNFIASQRLKEKYALTDGAIDSDEHSSAKLLSKVDKLFMTSRNIVKQAILHSQFPGLVYNMDSMLADQIETSEYLRKLEVDRSQEKPKQKVQAKHILTQKRKALADSYKLLATLGLSFRAGLMEMALRGELVDLKIPPFCMQSMIAATMRHKKIDQNLVLLSENLHLNYSRCVFKLKLLQTVMLTPNPELGLPNIERIKGFAVDLFLLVQSQRQSLAKSTIELHQLQQHIDSINELHEIITNNGNDFGFNKLSQKSAAIERAVNRILSVFEQYEILLKCVPSIEDNKFSALSSANVVAFTKSSEKYQIFKSSFSFIAQSARSLLAELQTHKNVIFHSSATIDTIATNYEKILKEINALCDSLKINAEGEHMVFVKPLVELLETIKIEFNTAEDCFTTNVSEENHSYENISNELENIIHHVLLSMQNIYKKYSVQKEILYEEGADVGDKDTTTPDNEKNDVDDANNRDNSTDDVIQPNHLKSKITEEIKADLIILNLPTILSKLSSIITVIRYTNNSTITPEEEKARHTCAQKLVTILPILNQYDLLCKYFLIQQFGAHKVSTKMLNVMLTVFIELGAKGFCIPPDLMQDEDGEKNDNEDGKEGEGFGLEDGTGDKDVSDKIESEDQLDTAKKPGEDEKDDNKEDADCKEENGIDMSDDFDSKLQDVEKRGDDSDDNDQSDNEDELDKQMGETEEGADKLDDQIWGSDEEKDDDEDDEENENEMNDEQDGKGSKDEVDQHNNLETEKDNKQSESEEGLDAADNEEKEKKKKEKDIDELNEPDVGDDQVNPYHNELEEPPEPEDMDLGNVNLDNEENNDNDDRNEENPFDIDTMKDNMGIDQEIQENENEEDGKDDDGIKDDCNENSDSVASDNDGEEEELKKDETETNENEDEADNVDDKAPETQTPGNIEPDENPENEENADDGEQNNEKKNLNEEFQQSKDKPSDQDNVQAMPDNKQKGSTDQVQIENKETQKQDDDLDMQDTGEDKDGVGQAENEESKSGHQGIADTKDTKNTNQQPDRKKLQERRKPGATDEDRTISESKKEQRQQLKTVDKMSDEPRADDEENEKVDNENMENDEYQHVKDAKKTDKTTMDNATDEQSKKIKDDEVDDKEEKIEDLQTNDELMETPEDNDEEMENVENLISEKNENDRSKEKGTKNDRQNETCDTKQEGDVEGEVIPTYNVPRCDETTAHYAMDIVQDTSTAQDLTNAEILDMRKLFENERSSNKLVHAQQEDFEVWQMISNKMLPNARELCEQLRLILEPTKCTRLKGDYRTGRRINMKKIIPYIASQFRKDKIWLRRTKPAKRDYKITIAIDDSKSMDYNNSKTLTLQAISLVSQALTLLESGRLNILSFGEAPQILLNHSDQFDGPKLVKSLNFAQNHSRIAELLEFVRIANDEDSGGSSDNGIFENLLLVLSDGRNIFSEGEKKVRNAIKLARMQRIFVVYIIIDNPENKHSVLDIRVPQFAADKKTITMKSYLDTFPFPYYVIVRDLAQLPLVLSDAMRQWFELVSSEQ